MECMLYIDPSPLWCGGGGPESLPSTPPYHWGGAAITDHGIIYIYIHKQYMHEIVGMNTLTLQYDKHVIIQDNPAHNMIGN